MQDLALRIVNFEDRKIEAQAIRDQKTEEFKMAVFVNSPERYFEMFGEDNREVRLQETETDQIVAESDGSSDIVISAENLEDIENDPVLAEYLRSLGTEQIISTKEEEIGDEWL